jgi:hypothetical protein
MQCTDIMDMILESYPKKKKDLVVCWANEMIVISFGQSLPRKIIVAIPQPICSKLYLQEEVGLETDEEVGVDIATATCLS